MSVEAPDAGGLVAQLKEMGIAPPSRPLPPPKLADLDPRPSRARPEFLDALRAAVGEDRVRLDPLTRVIHGAGKSYGDLIRLRLGRAPSPPDAVVFPETQKQVLEVIRLAADHGAGVIPFGGGTSVVGGVTADELLGLFISLDVTGLNRVIDIDPQAGLARVEAGIMGPALEEALNRRGCTLGHFPQSFEFSTLGGWIAARGAGHKSVRYGVMADRVFSLTAATVNGWVQTPRTPNHAAGGDLTGLLVGSEGALAVITEAEIKISPLAASQWAGGFFFPDFDAGREAVREALAQGLKPSLLRLSDAAETRAMLGQARGEAHGRLSRSSLDLLPRYLRFRGIDGPEACLLLIGLEGDGSDVRRGRRRVKRIIRGRGGAYVGGGPARAWHRGRYGAPYLRDELISQGYLIETIETAGAWGRLPDIHRAVGDALRESLTRRGQSGLVMAHVSHAYETGANLYFTFLAPQAPGRELVQWQKAKDAALGAIIQSGGALSHHHGVGRDHKPFLAEYWGADLAGAMTAAKQRLDPGGIMNPGALVDPEPPPEALYAGRAGLNRDGRRRFMEQMESSVLDVLVLGGGVVGAGAAWDAALRGLYVGLAEKRDFAFGASGKSSRMIHGGLRYLKMLDFKLVREALHERRRLLDMAPHLVRPFPHLVPVYKGQGDRIQVLHFGLWMYDVMAGRKGLPHHQTLSREEILEMAPGLTPDGLEGGLLYYDALTDDARLTVELIKAAHRLGALPVNHLEAVGIDASKDPARVTLKDHLSGREFEARARVVINAGGAWSDQVRGRAEAKEALLRPSKGVHISFPRSVKPVDQVLILHAPDGRAVFAAPSGETVYVGTTDEAFHGDLDAPRALSDEAAYLLAAFNHAFTGPPVRLDQVRMTWAGVRPLINSGEKSDQTRTVSREHEIMVEQNRLITVTGGKLTTFRVMAAQAVDRAWEIIKGEAPQPTPTAQTTIARPEPPDLGALPEAAADRLSRRYGPDAEAIARLAAGPFLAAFLDEKRGLLAAEVLYAVEQEMGLTLEDVMVRRLGLTYHTTDAGREALFAVADRMAGRLGWTSKEKNAQIERYQALLDRETRFKQSGRQG